LLDCAGGVSRAGERASARPADEAAPTKPSGEAAPSNPSDEAAPSQPAGEAAPAGPPGCGQRTRTACLRSSACTLVHPPRAPPPDCEQLPRTACLRAPACTLVHPPQGPRRSVYACRPATSPCEGGIVQAEIFGNGSSARACVARAGCRVDEGSCYCSCRGYGETRLPDGPEAESCNCACGGGPPPSCVDGS